MQTICWVDNTIVDYASAGKKYTLDGQVKELYKYTFGFGDTAITSSDGQYAFIYQKLGTKGLLLKNGDILREINKQVTDDQDRNPSDYFHSRLEISPNGKYLMSKGWFWHPWNDIRLFDIRKCFDSPEELDKSEIYPNVGTEICTASFIDENKVLIGSSDEEEMNDELLENLPQKHIAIWDIELNQISKPIKIQSEFGNLFAINEKFAWDLFKFPKIIDLETGEIVDKDESLASGLQKSSIIHHIDKLPKVAFNRQTKQIAITKDENIEILEQ